MQVVRAVKVECVAPRRVVAVLREVYLAYRAMLEYALAYALENNVKSFVGLKGRIYKRLRGMYPGLPSHYAYTVCQDAANRVKSFLKLKRRDLARTEKPEVRRVSIWLDDHLWRLEGYTRVKIATHRGWVEVGLRPHKLYWRYANKPGWRLAGEAKLRLGSDKAELIFTFRKEVYRPYKPKAVVPVDLNENNVTFKAGEEVYVVKTNLKRLVVGYHEHRRRLQKKHQQKRPRLFRRLVRALREGERKRGIRCQVASLVVKRAKELGAVVVLENLPKMAPANMALRANGKLLRHRIYQAGFRAMLKAIVEECLENDVPYALVNPRGTSSTCPFCGSKLVRGCARRLRCPGCNLQAGRDVIAVLNLEKRYLQMGGAVPFTPKPHEAGAKPMNPVQRAKSPPQIQIATKMIEMMRWGQTESGVSHLDAYTPFN